LTTPFFDLLPLSAVAENCPLVIGHVHAAPHGMGELAEADRGAVAVARHAQIDQVAIGQVGAGQHRWHAAMDGVEAVARAQEIVGRL
jgi:hypothetical protein